MADLKKIAEKLVNLTVKEVNELTDILKEDYGIEPFVSIISQVVEKEKVQVVEEQIEFDVILKAAGGSKLKVVKLIKELTNFGLKESKSLADNAPSVIKEKITKNEAETIKNTLEAIGAEIEIK